MTIIGAFLVCIRSGSLHVSTLRIELVNFSILTGKTIYSFVVAIE
jgi:hypothetical protein